MYIKMKAILILILDVISFCNKSFCKEHWNEQMYIINVLFKHFNIRLIHSRHISCFGWRAQPLLSQSWEPLQCDKDIKVYICDEKKTLFFNERLCWDVSICIKRITHNLYCEHIIYLVTILLFSWSIFYFLINDAYLRCLRNLEILLVNTFGNLQYI